MSFRKLNEEMRVVSFYLLAEIYPFTEFLERRVRHSAKKSNGNTIMQCRRISNNSGEFQPLRSVAILLPILIVVPNVTRAVSQQADALSIQRREVFLLPIALIVYGLLVWSIETESFWKLLILAILFTAWGATLVSFMAPFSS